MAVETSQALQHLHHLLQQLEDAETLLAHGPKRIAVAKRKIADAEQICAEQKEKIKTLRMEADQKSLNLKLHEDEIQKLSMRLNEASSNREFDIIQGQLESEQSARDTVEDEVLSLLTQVDEAGGMLTGTEGDVSQYTQRCCEIETEVRDKDAGIRDEITRVNHEISEAESAIPAGESRDGYRRLRTSMSSGALSEVQDAFCLTCNTRVIAQDCVRIKLGEFVTCRQCGRILYTAE